MAYHDRQYLELVRTVLDKGVYKPNRTGVGTLSIFGHQMKFDLRDQTIPMLTTKKMFTRGIIHEILWYLQGADNIKYLKDNNVTIWDEWAREDGGLGPVYGFQWRKWPTATGDIDQIARLVDKLKNNPNDRRMIVSAWNVGQLEEMALPPCHYVFQCYARPLTTMERVYEAGRLYHSSEIIENTNDTTVDGWLDEVNIPKYELSLLLNQRSCDVGLGVPFNIVQYSILTRMLAHVANMTPGDFIWNGGDVHVYENHVAALEEQLKRTPLQSPTFRFARKIDSIDDFKYDDFEIVNYSSHPTIKMDVAV